MAKRIATNWKVVVGTTDLSDHAFNVAIADEKEKVDVSGFGGTREYLQGLQDASVTVQFVNDMGSSSVFLTTQPLYEGGSVFAFFVQPDRDAGTSDTNKVYGGSACLFSYPVEASLNEREELSLEFAPAPNSAFTWGTVAP